MNSIEPLSPIKAARRDKILDTAKQLFCQFGFRGTTMEGIAYAVGMSKATVYSYFNDKDAVFEAATRKFCANLEEAFRSQLSADGAIEERIAEAFVTKYSIAFDVVRSSPFAAELFATSNAMVADAVEALSNEVEAMLVEALTGSGIAKDDAEAKARILYGAVLGISDYTKTYDDAVSDIRAVVLAVVGQR